MKPEQTLELQACLDGELSERAARRVADWMAKDPEAQSLAAELRMTKTALAGNDPELAVPESRDFYWSKIRRVIGSAGPAEHNPDLGWLFAWRRYLLPLSSLALVAILAIGIARFSGLTGSEDPWMNLTEVESLSGHFTSHSFRSRSENVFVVWISPQDQVQEETPATEEEDDIVIQ
jgi:anti-sigma factor RsiW